MRKGSEDQVLSPAHVTRYGAHCFRCDRVTHSALRITHYALPVLPSYNRPPVAHPMNPAVLRLLDANANRAREGLRVIEDYTRFVLNDGQLSAELKDNRHELSDVLTPLLPAAILHRDTPGD